MNKEKKIIINDDQEEEEDELENKKMDMFYSLIKNYQETKIRRRLELAQDSGDTPTKKSDAGENSGNVPVFRTEDFFHCIDLNLKPPTSSIVPPPIKNNQEEEEDKEKREDLDLNLAL
ncbi:hypothetical protein AALP_AA6G020900 [Arabis alpina]|uniref:Uncharacterized protein n=1 Tax=Arabis alpina TaxID=50452 RepID=A0A087GLI7_ARAAL|nr:hypothetical protein AALP_AA6G020900 [Arabis alpina]